MLVSPVTGNRLSVTVLLPVSSDLPGLDPDPLSGVGPGHLILMAWGGDRELYLFAGGAWLASSTCLTVPYRDRDRQGAPARRGRGPGSAGSGSDVAPGQAVVVRAPAPSIPSDCLSYLTVILSQLSYPTVCKL